MEYGVEGLLLEDDSPGENLESLDRSKYFEYSTLFGSEDVKTYGFQVLAG